MSVSYCKRYIQIKLYEETPLLAKVLEYAKKHFCQHCQLSSSVLILDDGERFKKDYLINWAYHASLQEDNDDLETLLSWSFLPIRIKIIKKNDMLQKVKVSICVVGLNKVVLKFSQENPLVKRYLKILFKNHIAFESKEEIELVGSGETFWSGVMDLIDLRVIHNVVLEFDYNGFGKKFGNDSFLTQEEQKLKQCYLDLECGFDDDFVLIKKRYLKLARIYHPDNVYGKDVSKLQAYQERFRKINEAYETIKKLSINAS